MHAHTSRSPGREANKLFSQNSIVVLHREPPCRSHVCSRTRWASAGLQLLERVLGGVPQSQRAITVRPLHPRHPGRPTTPSSTHKTGEAVANYATRSSVHVGVATWHRHGPPVSIVLPRFHLPSFLPLRSTPLCLIPSYPLLSGTFTIAYNHPKYAAITFRSAPPVSRTNPVPPPLPLTPPR